jgi:pimeloyl-ACP methyl ester carboxylesterase
MAPLGQLLGRRFRVYAPDFPGYGNSPKPPRTLTIRELADELGAFASRFDKPILIGNSMGCQVMIDLVARTDLASRIVLIGPTIDSESGCYLLIGFMEGRRARNVGRAPARARRPA